MTTPTFPRPRDKKPHAWGLVGATPARVWERFSDAYEAQAERLVNALSARGLDVFIDGAGSQDGEYITTRDQDGEYLLLIHLEDPAEAERIAALDDAGLQSWIDRALAGDA